MKLNLRNITAGLLLAAGAMAPLSLWSAIEDMSLEDVLLKVEEANGGAEALAAVTNARFRGEVQGADSTYEFVLLKKRPDKMRIHLITPLSTTESCYNGETGWRRFNRAGYDKVVQLEGKALTRLRLESDFDGAVVGEIAEGGTRELIGIERIDRVDYFVIATENELGRTLHYIDSRTFREYKTVKKDVSEDGESGETVAYFKENQRHAQIWVSHRVERHLPDGKKETILIKEVEINPGILDRVFDMPEERNPVPQQ
jgi:outer membrane lipoprotein-sorting protein